MVPKFTDQGSTASISSNIKENCIAVQRDTTNYSTDEWFPGKDGAVNVLPSIQRKNGATFAICSADKVSVNPDGMMKQSTEY